MRARSSAEDGNRSGDEEADSRRELETGKRSDAGRLHLAGGGDRQACERQKVCDDAVD